MPANCPLFDRTLSYTQGDNFSERRMLCISNQLPVEEPLLAWSSSVRAKERVMLFSLAVCPILRFRICLFSERGLEV